MRPWKTLDQPLAGARRGTRQGLAADDYSDTSRHINHEYTGTEQPQRRRIRVCDRIATGRAPGVARDNDATRDDVSTRSRRASPSPALVPTPRRLERDAARPAGRTPVVKWVATLVLAAWLLLSASCTGAAQPGAAPSAAPTGTSTTQPSSASARPTTVKRHRTQVALVTAELRNELVVVSLPGGRVVRRLPVAPDPKTVSAAPGGPVAVVSPGSGTVTMFGAGLRRLAVFRGFRSP